MDQPVKYFLGTLDEDREFIEEKPFLSKLEMIEISSVVVRDALDVYQMLQPKVGEGWSVTNYERVEVLRSVDIILWSTELICDDLMREIDQRNIDPEHVDALRRNGVSIRETANESFFVFLADLAYSITNTADGITSKLRHATRFSAQMRTSLMRLQADTIDMRDRNVVLSKLAPASINPAPIGTSPPLVITGMDPPAPSTDRALLASDVPLANADKLAPSLVVTGVDPPAPSTDRALLASDVPLANSDKLTPPLLDIGVAPSPDPAVALDLEAPSGGEMAAFTDSADSEKPAPPLVITGGTNPTLLASDVKAPIGGEMVAFTDSAEPLTNSEKAAPPLVNAGVDPTAPSTD